MVRGVHRRCSMNALPLTTREFGELEALLRTPAARECCRADPPLALPGHACRSDRRPARRHAPDRLQLDEPLAATGGPGLVRPADRCATIGAASGRRGAPRPLPRSRLRPGTDRLRVSWHRLDGPPVMPVPAAGPPEQGIPQDGELHPGPLGPPLETAAASTGSAAQDVASVKRGLKRGLPDRMGTVLLMLDATIVTETPPWYYV